MWPTAAHRRDSASAVEVARWSGHRRHDGGVARTVPRRSFLLGIGAGAAVVAAGGVALSGRGPFSDVFSRGDGESPGPVPDAPVGDERVERKRVRRPGNDGRLLHGGAGRARRREGSAGLPRAPRGLRHGRRLRRFRVRALPDRCRAAGGEAVRAGRRHGRGSPLGAVREGRPPGHGPRRTPGLVQGAGLRHEPAGAVGLVDGRLRRAAHRRDLSRLRPGGGRVLPGLLAPGGRVPGCRQAEGHADRPVVRPPGQPDRRRRRPSKRRFPSRRRPGPTPTAATPAATGTAAPRRPSTSWPPNSTAPSARGPGLGRSRWRSGETTASGLP